MDIKHKEVVSWLREVYGGEQIPPYEKTERGITLLHSLMTASRRSEDNSQILAEDFVTKTSEYSAEAKQLNKWLHAVNIVPEVLSEEGQTRLTALAHTAQTLDVQIPTCTNVILAMNELEMNHMQVLARRKQEQTRTSHLLEMSREVSGKLEEVRGIHQQAEMTWQQQQEEHAKNTKQEGFVKEKCNNYLADISSYEARLNKVGMTGSITHQALGTQWTELQALEKQVSELEDELRSYTLPPDLALAQVEVEAARQELSSIMESFATAYKQPDAP
ncbi:HAUS augmin-like complex subunit 1 [Chionoecetes opilio]|uniref:HAUS augmin-like complex subunit 1 n=1 Tax=Chionoecetes opilio TaxID=41210 RepID=A0A8J4Y1Y2_CHIOP|nr:HAUS augmin-like complex subunit 1 [Chionoecetes opilio]